MTVIRHLTCWVVITKISANNYLRRRQYLFCYTAYCCILGFMLFLFHFQLSVHYVYHTPVHYDNRPPVHYESLLPAHYKYHPPGSMSEDNVYDDVYQSLDAAGMDPDHTYSGLRETVNKNMWWCLDLDLDSVLSRLTCAARFQFVPLYFFILCLISRY